MGFKLLRKMGLYNSRGASLLAMDGGVHGARRSHIIGVRLTSSLPF